MRGLVALPLALLLGAASPEMGAAGPATAGANLRIEIDGLRDHKGMLRFCLTRIADYMKCDTDKGAVRLSVPSTTGEVVFENMTPGEWSLLVIHDSNSNGKLDTHFGIPREGFGFSGNPPIRFGPPSAASVRFAVPAGTSVQHVKVRYIF